MSGVSEKHGAPMGAGRFHGDRPTTTTDEELFLRIYNNEQREIDLERNVQRRNEDVQTVTATSRSWNGRYAKLTYDEGILLREKSAHSRKLHISNLALKREIDDLNERIRLLQHQRKTRLAKEKEHCFSDEEDSLATSPRIWGKPQLKYELSLDNVSVFSSHSDDTNNKEPISEEDSNTLPSKPLMTFPGDDTGPEADEEARMFSQAKFDLDLSHVDAVPPELQANEPKADIDYKKTDENTLLTLGVEAFRTQRFVHALRCFKAAIAKSINNGNHVLEARACGNLSNVYSMLGDMESAWCYFRHSLFLLRKMRQTHMESYILENGIHCCVQLGRFDEALGLALRKMAVSDNHQDHKRIASWIDKINRGLNGEFDLLDGAAESFSHDNEQDRPTSDGDDGLDPTPKIVYQGQEITVRALLVQFYKKHRPEKLQEVDELLEKYRGFEEQLLARLQI